MPKQHSHVAVAQELGVNLEEIHEDLFGEGFNNTLRGWQSYEEHLEYLRSKWGKDDPRTKVAESVTTSFTPEEVNRPLIDVVDAFRRQGLRTAMATVQFPERFAQMRNLLSDYFDDFFATCEMGLLKVEPEDRKFILPGEIETLDEFEQKLLLYKYYLQTLGAIAVEHELPKCLYFSEIIRRSNLKADQVAYFDDREDNIKAARYVGINAHIYESPEQVERILSL